MLETEKRIQGGGLKPMPMLIAAAVFAALAAAGYYRWKADAEAAPAGPVLTAAARAYLPHLDLRDVTMSAAESALGHTLVEIVGAIENLGGKPIRSVKLNCVFYEINGIELDRVPAAIVRANAGLPPGGKREFRLAFDAIPEGWNQTMPNLFIAEIVFGTAP